MEIDLRKGKVLVTSKRAIQSEGLRRVGGTYQYIGNIKVDQITVRKIRAEYMDTMNLATQRASYLPSRLVR
ncbi:hypothetical protein B9G55_11195 [Saccharibacillus sp. O16]|nr:hypothetical protein B9G55_11195 [Saccharibacillus sp. O16]